MPSQASPQDTPVGTPLPSWRQASNAKTSRPSRARSWSAGFSLIGLIVTLTIVGTLSGVATIFYEGVVEEQSTTVASHEIEEYSQAVRAYVLRGKKLSPETLDAVAAEDGEIPGGYRLDFLVEEGLFPQIKQDPWGNVYRIDPATGVVYSLGPDPSDASDDIRKTYTNFSESDGSEDDPFTSPIGSDQIPPVIGSVQPVGSIKVNTPVIRASFYDQFGGTVDQSSAKMFLDQVDMAGTSGLTTQSVGEIYFTTPGILAEGRHTVVVQVSDTAGNIARREWQFLVDSLPASVQILEPKQGEAVRGTIYPEFKASDDSLKSVTVRLDFGKVNDRFKGQNAPFVGAPPPQNGGGTIYHGLWKVPVGFDTTDDLYPDGSHFLTVLAEDYSGRVVSEQNQFLIDNTNPLLEWRTPVAPGALPPSTGPQRIATTVPIFEVLATDTLQVERVEYWYEDTSNLGTKVGVRGSSPVTGPEIMVPVDYQGVPLGAWDELYNSAAEFASTTANSVPSYIPITLPQGEYVISAKAFDLAGNESTLITTTFVIDLSTEGFAGLQFVDVPFPQVPPVLNVATRIISGITNYSFRSNYDNYASGANSEVQTQGHLMMSLLGVPLPGTKVIGTIDDFDGSSFGRNGSFENNVLGLYDWSTEYILTGSESSTLHSTNNFSADTNEFHPRTGASLTARANWTGQKYEGAYSAEMLFDYQVADDVSKVTTFYIDTAYPNYASSRTLMFRRPDGNDSPLAPGDSVNFLTLTSPPTILLGGEIEDFLTPGGTDPKDEKAVMVDVSARINQDSLNINDPTGWISIWPGSAPLSHVATYGVLASAGATGPLEITTTGNPSTLDGNYSVDLRATDGAGHTTSWRVPFVVNTVGPIVEYVEIVNPQGGCTMGSDCPTVNELNGPLTVTSIEDSKLQFRFQARDEVNIDRIEYRIIERGGSAGFGSSVVPVIPPQTVASLGPFNVFQDQTGSAFRPAPTSYDLEVWGVAQGLAGPPVRTIVDFKFLVDLAIYAPNYGGACGGNGAAMSVGEQESVADYLLENLDNVRSVSIYDCTNNTPARTKGPAPSFSGLEAFMSATHTNAQTDVIVILDSFPAFALEDISGAGPWCPDGARGCENSGGSNASVKIEAFLESTDANILVFTGGRQPTFPRFTTAGAKVSGSSPLYVDVERMFDAGGIPVSQALHEDAYEVVTPRAKMLLPSLSTFQFAGLVDGSYSGGFSDDWGIYSSHVVNLGPGAQGNGKYDLLETFTRVPSNSAEPDTKQMNDSDGGVGGKQKNSAGVTRGGNFVLRDTERGGLAAFFMSYGTRDLDVGTHPERKPASNVGPVIEEFLERYVGGFDEPDGVGGGNVAMTLVGARHIPFDDLDTKNSVTVPKSSDASFSALWPAIDSAGKEAVIRLSDSTPGATVAATQDISADGNQVLVIAKSQGVSDEDADSQHGYLLRSDGSQVLLYHAGTFFLTSHGALRGRMSENGRFAAFVGSRNQNDASKSTFAPPTGDQNSQALWLYDLQQPGVELPAYQVTAGFAGIGNKTLVDLSGNGQYTFYTSEIDQFAAGAKQENGFAGAFKSPDGRQLYRFENDSHEHERVTTASDASVLPAGVWGQCAATYDEFFQNVYVEEFAANGPGDYVASVIRPTNLGTYPNCLNKVPQIMLSRKTGGRWEHGMITNCAQECIPYPGIHGLQPHENVLDVSDHSPPKVLFKSKGNLRGLQAGDGTAASNLTNAGGADPSIKGGGGGGTLTPAAPITDDFSSVVGTVQAQDDFGGSNFGWDGGWDTVNTGGFKGNTTISVATGGSCDAGSFLVLESMEGDAHDPTIAIEYNDGSTSITQGNDYVARSDFQGGYTSGAGWSGPWQEANDSSGSSGGYFRLRNGNGSCTKGDFLEFRDINKDHSKIGREIDLSSYRRAVLSFRIDAEYDENSNLADHWDLEIAPTFDDDDGDDYRLKEYNTYDNESCYRADFLWPDTHMNASQFLQMQGDKNGGNNNAWVWIDHLTVFGLKKGTSPAYERQLVDATTSNAKAHFYAVRKSGYSNYEMLSFESSTDGGSTWTNLLDLNASNAGSCKEFSLTLPDGTNRIRFVGTGLGHDSSDVMYLDNMRVISGGNAYDSGSGPWLEPWKENGDSTDPDAGKMQHAQTGGQLGSGSYIRFKTGSDINNPESYWISRKVDLSAFRDPHITVEIAGYDFDSNDDRVELLAFSDPDNTGSPTSIADVRNFSGNNNWGKAKLQASLRAWKNGSGHARIGFRIYDDNQWLNYEEVQIDNIEITEGGCLEAVCDNFRVRDASGGFGWESAKPWEEKNHSEGDDFYSGQSQHKTSNSNECRRDGWYLFDGDDTQKRELKRHVDEGIVSLMTQPQLQVYMNVHMDKTGDVFQVIYKAAGDTVVQEFKDAVDTGCKEFKFDIPNGTKEIKFKCDPECNMGGSGHIDIDNIRIVDVGAAGGYHAYPGIYLWRGSWSGTGGGEDDQFVQVADCIDGPCTNPRISPNGRYFVFEAEANEVHGLFGWDPSTTDPDDRRIVQNIHVGKGAVADPDRWDSPTEPTNLRKVFRGVITETNPASTATNGLNAMLQLIVPFDDQGSEGTDIRPDETKFNNNDWFKWKDLVGTGQGFNMPVVSN